MKLILMDMLVCPHCNVSFRLNILKKEMLVYSEKWKVRTEQFWSMRTKKSERGNFNTIWDLYRTNILEGTLQCEKCGNSYSIENGIPRILSDELRTDLGRMGRGNPRTDTKISRFMDNVAPVRSTDNKNNFIQIQKANQSNYGYEWKAFSHEYSGWETVYKEYYVFEDDTYFEGKRGLDAGCGMGRFSIVAAKKGAEIIGLDISNAIEPAYEKSKSIPLFHAIQGDIYNMPFRDDYFDFAQTLGVIHITPDPEAALLSIRGKVLPGSKIFIYVYPDFKDENPIRYYLLKVVNQLRRLTVKIPSNLLYWLLYLLLPFIVLFLYFPSWFLWNIIGLQKIATIFPYNYEQYKGRPLRDIHMNLLDRFGNPVERRYNRAEMEQWMERAGFRTYTLWFKDGWAVAALK
jgi:uncharacterized protein YbaR (Trm112 family)/SAM-dependent methyltransferase